MQSQKDNSRESQDQQLPGPGGQEEGQGPHSLQASGHLLPMRGRFQRDDLNNKQSQGDSSGHSQYQKLPRDEVQTRNNEPECNLPKQNKQSTRLLTCTVDDPDVALEKHRKVGEEMHAAQEQPDGLPAVLIVAEDHELVGKHHGCYLQQNPVTHISADKLSRQAQNCSRAHQDHQLMKMILVNRIELGTVSLHKQQLQVPHTQPAGEHPFHYGGPVHRLKLTRGEDLHAHYPHPKLRLDMSVQLLEQVDPSQAGELPGMVSLLNHHTITTISIQHKLCVKPVGRSPTSQTHPEFVQHSDQGGQSQVTTQVELQRQADLQHWESLNTTNDTDTYLVPVRYFHDGIGTVQDANKDDHLQVSRHHHHLVVNEAIDADAHNHHDGHPDSIGQDQVDKLHPHLENFVQHHQDHRQHHARHGVLCVQQAQEQVSYLSHTIPRALINDVQAATAYKHRHVSPIKQLDSHRDEEEDLVIDSQYRHKMPDVVYAHTQQQSDSILLLAQGDGSHQLLLDHRPEGVPHDQARHLDHRKHLRDRVQRDEYCFALHRPEDAPHDQVRHQVHVRDHQTA